MLLAACGNPPAAPTLTPTATEIPPTPTFTKRPTTTFTVTETATPTLAPTEIRSEVYTFDPAEHENITFDQLPFIDYETLKADDLSDIEVGSKVMEKAIAAPKMQNFDYPDATVNAPAVFMPSLSSYTDKHDKLPYKTLRAFRTEIDGKDFPGAIIVVKNYDGSVTKLKVIFPTFFAQPENKK